MTEVTTTREQILDAAEELIAEQGILGATLRGITGRAGANLAAVNYHFGSKEQLVREVLLRHIRPVNQERLRRFEALAVDAGVEEVLEAFLQPLFQLVTRQQARWPVIHRVMGRMLADPTEQMDVFRAEFAPMIERFLACLARCLPQHDPVTLFHRANFLVGGMIHYLRVGHLITVLSAGVCDGNDRDRALAEMIRYAAAGLRAPGGQ